MASPLYPHLNFAAHVDWQHVNSILLLNLERLAATKGIQVDVFSGYRDNKYSAANGGFSGDPHSQGRAVDATVNGKPIGTVVPLNVLARFGLIGGNQPNFYHGKPDPEHVQLTDADATENGTVKMVTTAQVGQPTTANTGGIKTVPPSPANDYQTVPAKQSTNPATRAPAPAPASAATPNLPAAPQVDEGLPVAGGPPAPESTLPMVLAPGSGAVADAAVGGYVNHLWQQIASQPNASPDTLSYVQNVALSGG